MTRRAKSDTVKGAVQAMRNATTRIPVPAHIHVPDEALPFWESITKARAADRWNDTDLELAGEMARSKASIERLNKEIADEGDIIINARGTPIVSPKHNLLETLTRRVIALSRSLQVHAEATQGKSREQVPQNKAQAEAAKMIASIDSELLPGIAH